MKRFHIAYISSDCENSISDALVVIVDLLLRCWGPTGRWFQDDSLDPPQRSPSPSPIGFFSLVSGIILKTNDGWAAIFRGGQPPALKGFPGPSFRHILRDALLRKAPQDEGGGRLYG